MNIRSLFAGAAAIVALAASAAAVAQTAICYNCPPEWADWGTQLKAIKEKTGITVPPDNKNSGQTLAQLVAEKASPVADGTPSVPPCFSPSQGRCGRERPSGHFTTFRSKGRTCKTTSERASRSWGAGARDGSVKRDLTKPSTSHEA